MLETKCFLCSHRSSLQSEEWLNRALMSPLIPLKLNFNGLLLVSVHSFCLWFCVCCILPHSQFPLQVERLLHIVLATAQADEDGVGAGCHLLLVLLLQLKGTLQILIKQQSKTKYCKTKKQTRFEEKD